MLLLLSLLFYSNDCNVGSTKHFSGWDLAYEENYLYKYSYRYNNIIANNFFNKMATRQIATRGSKKRGTAETTRQRPQPVEVAVEAGRVVEERQQATAAVGTGKVSGVTVSEALKKRLRAAVGVQNLTMSEGVKIGMVITNEHKAELLARIVLLHYGFGAENQDLEEASSYLGLAFWELWSERQGKEAAADWNMVARVSGVTVSVVASSRDTVFPTGAVVDRETTIFVCRGSEDVVYVVLNPLRAKSGSAMAFVEEMLQRWSRSQREQPGVVDLNESEEDTGTRQAAVTRKNRSKGSSERGRRGEEGEIPRGDEETGKRYKFGDQEGPEFEVSEAHPVLEELSSTSRLEFERSMRRINARGDILWSSFIGGDIVRRFEMAFRWKYKSEFATARMSKKVFLQRTEELVNILSTSGSMKRTGEPRLHKDQGAAKTFVREIMEYRSRYENKYAPLEWCDRLLLNIEDKDISWAAEIRRNINLFYSESMAGACFMAICQQLEALEEGAAGAAPLPDSRDGGKADRRGDRGQRQGQEQYQVQGQTQPRGWQENNQGFSGQPSSFRQSRTLFGGRQTQTFPGQQASSQQTGTMQNQRVEYQQTVPPPPPNWPVFGVQQAASPGPPPPNWPVFGSQQAASPGPPPPNWTFFGGQQAASPGPPPSNWTFMGGQQAAAPGPPPAEFGHLPNKERRDPFKCYNCGDPGHNSANCPQPKRCKICGSMKHLAWACDGNGSTTGGTQQPPQQTSQQYVPSGSPKLPARATVTFAGSAGVGSGQPNGK